jgi:hypothetical protein
MMSLRKMLGKKIRRGDPLHVLLVPKNVDVESVNFAFTFAADPLPSDSTLLVKKIEESDIDSLEKKYEVYAQTVINIPVLKEKEMDDDRS